MVSRLGDVFGPVVNIASRLTSLARPGTVLVDRHAYEVLSGARPGADAPSDRGADGTSRTGRAGGRRRARAAGGAPTDGTPGSPYRFRRMRRSSVKGYAKLQSWVLRRA